MSALGLGVGRLAPGVWRGGSTSPADLVSLAEGLGWSVRQGTIDHTDDKAVYLTQLGAIAGVPSYVRSNWDSMADGLRDTGITDRRLVVIETSAAMPFDSTAIGVLNEAVAFWTRHNATMQVVWFGPVAAPALDGVDPVKRSRS